MLSGEPVKSDIFTNIRKNVFKIEVQFIHLDPDPHFWMRIRSQKLKLIGYRSIRIRNPGSGLAKCLERLTAKENTASVQGSILAVIQQSGVLRIADLP